MSEQYRRCSTCKAPIQFGSVYYTCSVSTCNQKRTALFFCSVPCWDAHVPGARHRDAWAEKQVAPKSAEVETDEPARRRVIVGRAVSPPGSSGSAADEAGESDDGGSGDGAASEDEVLIVVSKLKAYIRARSDMNTSSGVAEALSDHLRTIARDAIREAGKNGRKTVLERDVTAVLGRGRSDAR